MTPSRMPALPVVELRDGPAVTVGGGGFHEYQAIPLALFSPWVGVLLLVASWLGIGLLFRLHRDPQA